MATGRASACDGAVTPALVHERERLIRRAKERIVKRARWHFPTFFMYVMKHQLTGAPVSMAPFQEEWHWLADKYDRLLILAFMESGKSFQLSVSRTLWELGRDPTLQFAIISRTKDQAKKLVSLLAQYIESSPELHEVFPGLVPHPDPKMPWNSTFLTVARTNLSQEPSIQVVSVGKTIQGARIDRAILDDVLDRENTRLPKRRDDMWDWYQKAIPGRMTARGRVLAVGNAFHRQDLYHRLALNERWHAYRFPVVWPNGKSAWPGSWPMERIEARRQELQEIEFKIQMLCEPVDLLVSGMFFRRTEVEIVDSIPAGILKRVRRWDLAATEPHDGNWDPDWSCGVKMGRVNSGKWFVENVEFARKRAEAVRALILSTAKLDGKLVDIGLPQDPGQAGVDQAQSFVTWLAGYTVWTERETGDKLTRAEPFATQWQGHNVVLLRAPWNQRYLDLMEAFPTPGIHDDPIDASSGAFRRLLEEKDIFRQFRKQAQA